MKTRWALVTLAALAGCAVAPKQMAPIEDTRSFDASFDKVWGAIMATVTERGLGIQAVEKGSGIVTTTPAQVKSESFTRNIPVVLGDIGYKPFSMFGAWSEANYSFNIFANGNGDKTTVKITARIQGTDAGGSKHDIPSKGKLEADLFSAIAKKL